MAVPEGIESLPWEYRGMVLVDDFFGTPDADGFWSRKAAVWKLRCNRAGSFRPCRRTVRLA